MRARAKPLERELKRVLDGPGRESGVHGCVKLATALVKACVEPHEKKCVGPRDSAENQKF